MKKISPKFDLEAKTEFINAMQEVCRAKIEDGPEETEEQNQAMGNHMFDLLVEVVEGWGLNPNDFPCLL